MSARRTLIAAWLALPALAAGQEPVKPAPAGRPELRRALDALESVLADDDLPPLVHEQKLAAFLAAHAGHPELRPGERRSLQVRLAVLELSNRKPRAALTRFEAVGQECPRDAVDIRARCMLGAAQALETLGEDVEARRRYDLVATQFAGTSYARVARLARDRQPLRRGQPLAGARPVRTLDDRQLQLVRPGRRLLLFLPAVSSSATDAALLAALERRLPPDLLLCVAAPGQAQAERWRERILATGGVPLERLYLAADADLADDLKLGVLPFWLLLDGEGRVLEVYPDLDRLSPR